MRTRCSAAACWLGLVGVALCIVGPSATVADEPAVGAKLYQARCAKCHGDQGQGNPDEYELPLAGDWSAAKLAEYIAKEMPKDAKQKCSAEESQQVAAYIFDAFYSPLAQARIKPPRIELSRLTVRQYQNVVSDLVQHFRGPEPPAEKPGLAAEYYKGRRFRNQDRVLERIDPQVDFDFKDGTPVPDKIEPQEFSIRWNGTVLAPESGEYEFFVVTDHAARLWINDLQEPLIDAWVKSGNDTEYHARTTLLGGRRYALRLEFSKAKQGVDDSDKKQKTNPPLRPAMVKLAWKRPQLPREPIPGRLLATGRAPRRFVVTTPFPPDDRSVGYERGSSISKAWDQATTDAAIETAGYVTKYLEELSGANERDAKRTERLQEFCRRFAEFAFGRPLSAEQKQIYVERRFAHAKDPETAVKQVVLLVLKSPRFLYREAGAAGHKADAYTVAGRLALGLWDSLPDRPLWDAARANQLSSREQLAKQAERMLADPRAKSKLRTFLLVWLKVDQPPDLSKNTQEFPGFDAAVAADLRTSLELTLDEFLASEQADFRQLLTNNKVFLNGRLAKFYGVKLPEDAPFQPTELNPEERRGVVTHPYLLAAFAYTDASSPIHRGVFLSRSLLGRVLRPPPEAVAPLAVDLNPDLTTRERVALQTKAAACNICHQMINPLGFALERFDGAGRYRSQERGKPVDASGHYDPRSGPPAKFQGGRELAEFLAGNDEVHTAFVDQLYRHLTKQPLVAYGEPTRKSLHQAFVADSFHVRRLMVQMITTAATYPEPVK